MWNEVWGARREVLHIFYAKVCEKKQGRQRRIRVRNNTGEREREREALQGIQLKKHQR